MAFTVLSKHLKTLNRRMSYLGTLDDSERNSYDAAEIAALKSAIKSMELVKSWEDATGEEFENEVRIVLDQESDDED